MIILNKLETFLVNGGDMECYRTSESGDNVESFGETLDADTCKDKACGWKLYGKSLYVGWSYNTTDTRDINSPLTFDENGNVKWGEFKELSGKCNLE